VVVYVDMTEILLLTLLVVVVIIAVLTYITGIGMSMILLLTGCSCISCS